MNTFSLIISAILLLLNTAVFASAQCDLVVSASGSDSNSGTVDSPLATPETAISRVAAGGVICLRAGSYRPATGLILDKSLTLRSYPGEWAALVADNSSASPVGNVVFVTANNVTIQDLEISGGSYYGIHVNSYYLGYPPANTLILRTKVHDSGYTGIKVYQGDNVQVIGSEVYAVGNLQPGSGIDILAAIPSAANPSGNGATVRGTWVHDVPSGIVIKAGTVRGLIEQNRVERVGGGIYAGGESGAQYFRNAATSECIDCTVRNNIVLNASALGLSCWGAQGARIVNNTVLNAASSIQAAFFSVPDGLGYTCNNLNLQNNIFVTSGVRPLVHMVSPGPGITIDYNAYYNSIGNYSFWWESPALTGYWSSLNAWQSGTGEDAHSIGYRDPSLDAANNYTPLMGSPVVDAGITLAAVTNDYLGTSRPQGAAYDIGAVELRQTAPAPVPTKLITVSGSGQSTLVGTAFFAPLTAKVTDAFGNGVVGVAVTFTAPAFGASASFGGSASAQALTNAVGVATSPVLTANANAGTYNVVASASSLPTASFTLTNTPALLATQTMLTGGTVSAGANSFALKGTVTSAGKPVPDGTAQIFVNGKSTAIVPVAKGAFSWNFPIPAGSRPKTSWSVWAVYSGTATYSGSLSPTVLILIR